MADKQANTQLKRWFIKSFCVMSLITASHAELPTNKPSIEQLHLQEADIVFHESLSSQSKAIQQATHSKYSHMGMLITHQGQLQVLEAVQPVKITPLKQWQARGNQQKIVIKRLKLAINKPFTQQVLTQYHQQATRYLGKPYDFVFAWNDDQLYCSELVWKIYKESFKVELSSPKVLQQFDLTSSLVKKKLHERYGKDVPIKEKVIAPVDIFDSPKLVTIYSNE